MAVDWQIVEDGEFNEHVATINGVTVNVFSDRDGYVWSYREDDGEMQDLKAHDLRHALLEVTSIFARKA